MNGFNLDIAGLEMLNRLTVMDFRSLMSAIAIPNPFTYLIFHAFLRNKRFRKTKQRCMEITSAKYINTSIGRNYTDYS